MFVVEDDLSLFQNLETLKASENALPFARLGVLPALKKLVLSCNGITSLDLDVEGKFKKLEVS
jgi:Leucine-rich repeat (LRR) protein